MAGSPQGGGGRCGGCEFNMLSSSLNCAFVPAAGIFAAGLAFCSSVGVVAFRFLVGFFASGFSVGVFAVLFWFCRGSACPTSRAVSCFHLPHALVFVFAFVWFFGVFVGGFFATTTHDQRESCVEIGIVDSVVLVVGFFAFCVFTAGGFPIFVTCNVRIVTSDEVVITRVWLGALGRGGLDDACSSGALSLLVILVLTLTVTLTFIFTLTIARTSALTVARTSTGGMSRA